MVMMEVRANVTQDVSIATIKILKDLRLFDFCYFFHNLQEKRKLRKSCQNTVNQSISGGKINMIKILFVCYNSNFNKKP